MHFSNPGIPTGFQFTAACLDHQALCDCDGGLQPAAPGRCHRPAGGGGPLVSHACREQLQRGVWIPQFRIGGLSMSAESVFLTARLPRTQFAAAIQAVSHAGMIQIQNVVQQK